MNIIVIFHIIKVFIDLKLKHTDFFNYIYN